MNSHHVYLLCNHGILSNNIHINKNNIIQRIFEFLLIMKIMTKTLSRTCIDYQCTLNETIDIQD